jgi:hypothetical protein
MIYQLIGLLIGFTMYNIKCSFWNWYATQASYIDVLHWSHSCLVFLWTSFHLNILLNHKNSLLMVNTTWEATQYYRFKIIGCSKFNLHFHDPNVTDRYKALSTQRITFVNFLWFDYFRNTFSLYLSAFGLCFLTVAIPDMHSSLFIIGLQTYRNG